MSDLMELEVDKPELLPPPQLTNLVDESESGLQMTQSDDDLDHLTLRFFRDAPVIIEKAPQKGRFVVSGRAIRAGEQILVVPEPYGWCVSDEFKRFACALCLHQADEALPAFCELCQQAWYCCLDCKEAHRTVHQFECNALRVLRRNLEWNYEDHFIARMVCSVLARRHAETVAPEAVTDSLRYSDVCVLIANKKQVGERVFTSRNDLWTWLTTVINKKTSFNFHDDWIELIGRIDENTFGIRANTNLSYAYGLYPSVSFFNHSCGPNVVVVQDRKRLIMYAIRDINEAEELNISYIEFNRTTAERRKLLKQEYNFHCLCPRCSEPEIPNKDPFVAKYVCPHPGCDGKGIKIPFARTDGSGREDWLCNLCEKAEILLRIARSSATPVSTPL